MFAAGLLLALGLASWPYVKRAWNGDSEIISHTAAKPGDPDGGDNPTSSSQAPALPHEARGPVEINIAYGTEKKNWLEAALRDYRETPEGRRSKINLIPLGSLEGANAVLEGLKPTPIHVWSPASGAYRTMFEQRWKEKHNTAPILHQQDLALTPMVFVMWRDRHEAFTRKYPKVNFRTIGEAMAMSKGWEDIADKPDWGHFKFTHTDPKKSNSGFLTLVLMAYESCDKLRDLTTNDISGPEFQGWLTQFEQRVARPTGSLTASTGTLMEEMVKKGPSQYDGLVVYENLAIDYMERAKARWGDQGELRITYPDPNVWNDHPYYILDAPWSSDAQKSAAREFLDFLMSEPIQRKALDHGFRPGNASVAVNTPDSPLIKHKENGLKIEVPRICEPPRSEVVSGLLSAFDHAEKR